MEESIKELKLIKKYVVFSTYMLLIMTVISIYGLVVGLDILHPYRMMIIAGGLEAETTVFRHQIGDLIENKEYVKAHDFIREHQKKHPNDPDNFFYLGKL